MVETKCPYCQEEVTESGFVYCPHCGKELKPGQDKIERIFNWHLVVWPVLTWLIASGICYWLDKRESVVRVIYRPVRLVTVPDNTLDWAPMAWGPIALYIVGIWIMYQHATHYNRNAVRWTTASIVFTPVLAWIAYGLSWRKS